MKPFFKHIRFTTSGFSVAVCLLLIVALFSHLTSSVENINIFFSSDSLYMPSVYNDLFVDENPLNKWHFNPAPNYFPEMLIYFLLMFITNNFIIASFVVAFIQYLVLGFLFVSIFKVIFPKASQSYQALIYTLLSVFLLEYFFFSKNFMYVFNFLTSGSHTGAFLVTLLCIILTFKYIQQNKVSLLIFIAILGFLMIISDRLFLILYVVPMCASCVFLYRRIKLKTALSLITVIGIVSIIGFYVHKMIDTDAYTFLKEPEKLVDQSVITSQFSMFLEAMLGYLSTFGFRALSLYSFLISMVLMAYVFFKTVKKNENILISFYAFFSIIFSICVICAPMLSGIFFSTDCLRYNLFPFYLSILNLLVFMAYIMQSGELRNGVRYSVLGLNGLLLLLALWLIKPLGLKEYFNYYPENVSLLDAAAEKQDLHYGVANYWESKKMTLFSKKGIKVYPVFDDISFYQHAANDAWFFRNVFNFAVTTSFSDTSVYKEKLKDIEIISTKPTFKLIKTRPFFYVPHIGSTAINTEIREQ